jgi:hypothetical protein
MSNLRSRSPRQSRRRVRFPRRRLALPLLVLALGVTPGAANEASSVRPTPTPAPGPATRPAASAKDPAAQMARWFSDLGHSDSRVREAARVSLMGLPRKDLPKLERLVRDNVPLVPSQAVVLRDIVTHVFLSGEEYESSSRAGFLGVRPGEANLNFREPPLQDPAGVEALPFGAPGDPGAVRGVVIIERMPGFAGARHLQDGDVVLSMVEQADLQFRVAEQFSQVVRAVGAGKTVHFQILRQGQIVRVPVTLDPRPDAADFIPTMTSLLNDRKAAADEYWETTFAPLLKEGVS